MLPVFWNVNYVIDCFHQTFLLLFEKMNAQNQIPLHCLGLVSIGEILWWIHLCTWRSTPVFLGIRSLLWAIFHFHQQCLLLTFVAICRRVSMSWSGFCVNYVPTSSIWLRWEVPMKWNPNFCLLSCKKCLLRYNFGVHISTKYSQVQLWTWLCFWTWSCDARSWDVS